MRVRHALRLCSAILILAAACEQRAEPAGGAAPGGAPVALAGGPAEATGDVRVKLLEAGAEPRQALRYVFSKEPASMLMSMDMGMAIGLGEMKQPPMQLPTMKMVMAIRPEEVRADGAVRYAFRLERTDVVAGDQSNPAMQENLRAELKKTEGLSGWALVDARGFTRDADAVVPPGASPQVKDMVDKLRQQMRQMSAPFPEEPVGLGARWEVHMAVATDMFRIEQVATYRLVKREGNALEMEVEVRQSAPAQEVKVPNLPGAKGKLLEMRSTGGGRMRVDLGRLVPESSMDSKTHLAMEIKANDQAPPQAVTTDMTLRLGLRAE